MRTLYVDLPENAGPVAETAFLQADKYTRHNRLRRLCAGQAAANLLDVFNDEQVADPEYRANVIQAVFLPLRGHGRLAKRAAATMARVRQRSGAAAARANPARVRRQPRARRGAHVGLVDWSVEV